MKTGGCKNGFTLMELLIAITIIGILLAISLITYSGFTSRAYRALCMTNQRTIRNTRMINYINYSTFGEELSDISATLNMIGLDMGQFLCPKGGTYEFIEDSPDVQCSIVEHNL